MYTTNLNDYRNYSIHIASFKCDGKFARNVGLPIDKSEPLPDRITCVKCDFFISRVFVAVL